MRTMLIIVNLLFGLDLYANNKFDDLKYAIDTCTSATERIDLINDLAYQYSRYKPDSGIYFAKMAMSESQEIAYHSGIAISMKWFGYFHYLNGNFDSCYYYYDRAEEVLIRNNDVSKIAGVKKLRASGYFRQGKAKDAIKQLKNAMIFAEKANNKKDMAGIWNNLGVMYAEINNIRASLSAYKNPWCSKKS